MMKFTCTALMLSALASASVAEIINYPIITGTYNEELQGGNDSNGPWSTFDSGEVNETNLTSHDWSFGSPFGSRLQGDLDSNSVELDSFASTSSYSYSTKADGRVWGEGSVTSTGLVSFELEERTTVIINASFYRTGTASGNLSLRGNGESIIGGQGDFEFINHRVTLDAGGYTIRTRAVSSSTANNPTPPGESNTARAYMRLTVVPSPSSALVLPMAFGMVCRRRR